MQTKTSSSPDDQGFRSLGVMGTAIIVAACEIGKIKGTNHINIYQALLKEAIRHCKEKDTSQLKGIGLSVAADIKDLMK